MNFHKTELEQCSLSTGAINILVLASEWFRCKEDAYKKTDILLLLLCGIHEVSKQNDCSTTTIQQRLDDTDTSLSNSYANCVREVASDLSQFMSLFNDLVKYTENEDDSQTAVLDRDLKNSVLSVFVRRCIQDYQRLTFSQLCRLHKQWSSSTEFNTATTVIHSSVKPGECQDHDFSHCLHKLMVPAHREISRCDNDEQAKSKQLEVEALHLAQLHGAFGHNEEGVYALQESIRLAQQMSNSVLLEYALGWLCRLQPMDTAETQVILSRFVKNAEDLNLPVLGLWGRLQQAKTLVSSGEHPRRVLQVLTCGESQFSRAYTDKPQMLSQKSSLIASQGAALSHFGHRLASVFYSLLPCFIEDCAFDEESFTLSVSSIAKRLFENGNYEKCTKLLQTAKNNTKFTVMSFKVICQCTEEIVFERALRVGEYSVARQHLHSLVTFNVDSSKLRFIQLAKHKREFQEAFDNAQALTRSVKDVSLLLECWLLLADTLSKTRSPALALPYVMAYVEHCEQHHLPTHSARLVLAHLQLKLGCARECLDLVESCLLHYSAHGSTPHKAKAYFLQAQAKLLMKGRMKLNSEDITETLSLLQTSINIYQTCGLHSEARPMQVLQVYLYDFMGEQAERNRLCGLLC